VEGVQLLGWHWKPGDTSAPPVLTKRASSCVKESTIAESPAMIPSAPLFVSETKIKRGLVSPHARFVKNSEMVPPHL